MRPGEVAPAAMAAGPRRTPTVPPPIPWEPLGKWLAVASHAGNVADLATSLWGMAAGARETTLALAWLIAHGWPEPIVLLASKAAAAATIMAARWAAGRPRDTSAGRIAAAAGMGTLAVLAAFMAAATVHNAILLLFQ